MPATIAIRPRTSPWSGPAIARAPEHVLLEAAAILNRSDAARVLHEEKGMPLDFATRLSLIWDAYLEGVSSTKALHETCACAGVCTPCKSGLTESLSSYEQAVADIIVGATEAFDAQGELWRQVRERMWGHPDGLPGVDKRAEGLEEGVRDVYRALVIARSQGRLIRLMQDLDAKYGGEVTYLIPGGLSGGSLEDMAGALHSLGVRPVDLGEGVSEAGMVQMAAELAAVEEATDFPSGLDEQQFVLYSPAAQRAMGGGTLGQPTFYTNKDDAAWALLQAQLGGGQRTAGDLVVAKAVRKPGGWIDYVPVRESAPKGWGKPGELAEADSNLRGLERAWDQNRTSFQGWLNLALGAARSGRRLHLVWGASKPNWAYFQVTQVDDNPPQMRIEYGKGIRGRTRLPKVLTPASWSQFTKAVGPALPELNVTYDNTPSKPAGGGRAAAKKLKTFLLTQDPYNDRTPVSKSYKPGDRRALERAAFTITGWGGSRLGTGAEGKAWIVQATSANEARLIAQGADALRPLAFNFWTNVDNLSLPAGLDLPPAGASPRERSYEPPVGGRAGLPQTRGGRGTGLDYYALDITRKLLLVGGAGAQPQEFPWKAVLKAAAGSGLQVRYTWGPETVSPDTLRDRVFPLARKAGWSLAESRLNEAPTDAAAQAWGGEKAMRRARDGVIRLASVLGDSHDRSTDVFNDGTIEGEFRDWDLPKESDELSRYDRENLFARLEQKYQKRAQGMIPSYFPRGTTFSFYDSGEKSWVSVTATPPKDAPKPAAATAKATATATAKPAAPPKADPWAAITKQLGRDPRSSEWSKDAATVNEWLRQHRPPFNNFDVSWDWWDWRGWRVTYYGTSAYGGATGTRSYGNMEREVQTAKAPELLKYFQRELQKLKAGKYSKWGDPVPAKKAPQARARTKGSTGGTPSLQPVQARQGYEAKVPLRGEIVVYGGSSRPVDIRPGDVLANAQGTRMGMQFYVYRNGGLIADHVQNIVVKGVRGKTPFKDAPYGLGKWDPRYVKEVAQPTRGKARDARPTSSSATPSGRTWGRKGTRKPKGMKKLGFGFKDKRDDSVFLSVNGRRKDAVRTDINNASAWRHSGKAGAQPWLDAVNKQPDELTWSDSKGTPAKDSFEMVVIFAPLNESWGRPGTLSEGPIYLRGKPTLNVTSDDGWSSWGVTYNGRSAFQVWTKLGSRWMLTGAYMMKDLPRSGPWKPDFLQGMPRVIPAKEVARIQRGATQQHGYPEAPKAKVIDLPRPKHPQGPAKIVGKPVLNRNNNYDGQVEWYVVSRNGTWGLTPFSSEAEARRAATRIFSIQRDGTEVFEGLKEALPGLDGLSSAERAAAIRRALGMPDAAPTSAGPTRVDQRKYRKVGSLARGFELWQRASKNSVFMVTREGQPWARAFKLKVGRKLLTRVRPGSGRGLEPGEFQLSPGDKIAVLGADLGKVLIESSIAEADNTIRDLERRARTGDKAAQAEYKRALNRAGRTPPNETFLGDQVKDAARLLRGAAVLLEQGSKQYANQPEDPSAPVAASPVEAAKNMKDFAKSLRSASRKLTQWKMPRVSAYRGYDPVPKRVQIQPTQSRGVSWAYAWDGYFRAADEAVSWAAKIMRSVANGVERETGKDVFVVAGWLDRFAHTLTYMRDRNAGYSYDPLWKKPIPVTSVTESDWGRPGSAR